MTVQTTYRWGILGTGAIAQTFAGDLSRVPGAQLVAVGSRTREAAEHFGARFGVPRCHASYEALAMDPEVEVIYIATPHALHHANARMCLEAGKAVLCEKAFTLNAREAADLIALAQERGLFLMEAMWTRFLPMMSHIRGLVAGGRIGELRMVMADFGFRAPFEPTSRLFDPHLGGGALLDVGIYPVSLASSLLGTPTRITAMAHLGETGVDEQGGIVFGYEGGKLALLAAALRTRTPTEAHLLGTEGRITLHHPWFIPTRLTLSVDGHPDETREMPFEGSGYQFEAAEVMRCLHEGKTQSDLMPLSETLSIMQTMDEIRRQWGLHYPGEMA